MPDSLSIVMGSVLSKVSLFGTVIVGMKFALEGQPLLTLMLLAPLALFVYLLLSDGSILR